MDETKSNVVKIRIEGASKDVTRVACDIKTKVRVVDESEIVQTNRNVVRRYLVALVKRDD